MRESADAVRIVILTTGIVVIERVRTMTSRSKRTTSSRDVCHGMTATLAVVRELFPAK